MSKKPLTQYGTMGFPHKLYVFNYGIQDHNEEVSGDKQHFSQFYNCVVKNHCVFGLWRQIVYLIIGLLRTRISI